MNLYDIAQEQISQVADLIAKASMTTAAMASAGVSLLDFDQAVILTNRAYVPILRTFGPNGGPIRRGRALATKHSWRELSIRAAATNINQEGSAANAATSLTPAHLYNSCQIFKSTVGVSRSSMIEAANGIYGDMVDFAARQLQYEVEGTLRDLEKAIPCHPSPPSRQ